VAQEPALRGAAVSDVLDLGLISGSLQEMTRTVGLMRLRLDAMVARLSGHDGRFGGIEGRLASLEQSFHDLTNETARGFGQLQQQLTRHEKRFDGLDAALAKLGTDLAENTGRIIREIRVNGR
jgi:DnaJ-domain-containing protein 1